MITRRGLLSFFALGGLLASLRARLLGPAPDREAMFWEEHPARQDDGKQGGETR